MNTILYPLPFSSGPIGREAEDEISTLWEYSFDDESILEEEDDGFAE
jgi:hypothetical protein